MSKKCICDAKECTLCLACMNSCPKDAIFIGTDDNGYEKIQIDSTKCVDCGICEQVCLRRKTVSRHTPVASYAAQAKDRKALERSASGGAFQMLAQIVLERGGVCYGCEFGKDDGRFHAKHVRIDTTTELHRILNSKYIPSVIGDTFRKAKQDLEAGTLVLFSGTPCQIQALLAFLNKDYNNLITADIICHGVTSTNLFNQYIACLEQKDDIQITDYYFRDKTISWGTNYCYSYRKKNDPAGRVRTRHCPREESSYMAHYLRRNIFREKCYECDCANTSRVSDFTLGDYWSIEEEHPEFVTQGKPKIALRKGVSCILVNSDKGKSFVETLEERMILHEVTLNSIVAHNGNLSEASQPGNDRQWLLSVHQSDGYRPIEDAYRSRLGSRIWVFRVKNILKSYLPDVIRIWIYRSPALRRLVFHD